jgi:hypothetical protein
MSGSLANGAFDTRGLRCEETLVVSGDLCLYGGKQHQVRARTLQIVPENAKTLRLKPWICYQYVCVEGDVHGFAIR